VPSPVHTLRISLIQQKWATVLVQVRKDFTGGTFKLVLPKVSETDTSVTASYLICGGYIPEQKAEMIGSKEKSS